MNIELISLMLTALHNVNDILMDSKDLNADYDKIAENLDNLGFLLEHMVEEA
jgi:uncharacterized protein YpuA (DUF1002 family)